MFGLLNILLPSINSYVPWYFLEWMHINKAFNMLTTYSFIVSQCFSGYINVDP